MITVFLQAIAGAISSTYKAAGSVTFANLGALTAANEGKVYNVSEAFTTTIDFVDGLGGNYPAGTNVVIINVGTAQNPEYKYDILSGFVDLSGYARSADLATVATTGSYTDLSNTPSLANVATTGNYNDLSNKPTIPAEVTETTVINWGFTKNEGTVTSVNNTQPDANGNVTLVIPDNQVQADWTENDSTSKAYILHKPTIPTVDQIYDKTSTHAQSGTAVALAISNKIDKYDEMPVASKADEDNIVQYVGDDDVSYVNGYFYKCAVTGNIPDSIEFTPTQDPEAETQNVTVVTVSMADFIAFLTPWCAGRSFEPSDVTHGHIGIYSSTQYSMTISTDDPNKYAYGVFAIDDLESAGFTFTPRFGARQGADFVCSINQKTYAWERVNVQPATDISGKQDVANLVTSLSASSTDTQYPSAKCVYDLVGDIEAALAAI